MLWFGVWRRSLRILMISHRQLSCCSRNRGHQEGHSSNRPAAARLWQVVGGVVKGIWVKGRHDDGPRFVQWDARSKR